MSEPVDIFVSYAREDEDRAGRLVRALEACGWRVFWDRTIPPGESWRSHIGVPLDQATVVVVVWSHHSIEADFVHAEANRARTRSALVPVLFDEVSPPLGFEHIQAADLTRWVAGAAVGLPDLLVRTLERRIAQPARVAPPPISKPAPAPPPTPIEAQHVTSPPARRLSPPMIAGVIAALVIGLGLGTLFGGRSEPGSAPAELAGLREQLRDRQDRLDVELRARREADTAAAAAKGELETVRSAARAAQAAAADANRTIDALRREVREAVARADAAERDLQRVRTTLSPQDVAPAASSDDTNQSKVCEIPRGAVCELERRQASGSACVCEFSSGREVGRTR